MDLIYRYDPFAPLKWKPPVDADEALQLLLDGHCRFVDFVGRMRPAPRWVIPQLNQ